MPDSLSSLPHLSGHDQTGRRFWLIFGLPWPSDDATVANAAYAVPALAGAYESREIAQIFAVVRAWASRFPAEPVVWFSDLTRWLDTLGLDWAQLGVDWHSALDALPDGRLPGMLLGIDQRTHAVLCDASRDGLTVLRGGRHERVTGQERARLRARMWELLCGPPATGARPASGGPGRSSR